LRIQLGVGVGRPCSLDALMELFQAELHPPERLRATETGLQDVALPAPVDLLGEEPDGLIPAPIDLPLVWSILAA